MLANCLLDEVKTEEATTPAIWLVTVIHWCRHLQIPLQLVDKPLCHLQAEFTAWLQTVPVPQLVLALADARPLQDCVVLPSPTVEQNEHSTGLLKSTDHFELLLLLTGTVIEIPGADCSSLCTVHKVEATAGEAALDLLQAPSQTVGLHQLVRFDQLDIRAQLLGTLLPLVRPEVAVVQDSRTPGGAACLCTGADDLTGQGVGDCQGLGLEAELQLP